MIGRRHASARGHAPALAAARPTGEAAAYVSYLLGRCLDGLRPPGQVTVRFGPGGVQGLTRRQVRVVRGLPEEGLTLEDLAQRLDLEHHSMMALADRLVRSGAARRERATGDPGTVRLLPTAAGAAMAEDYLGHQEVAIARLVALVPDLALSALALPRRILGATAGRHHSQSALQRAPSSPGARFPQTSNDDRLQTMPARRSPSRSPLANSSATMANVSWGDRVEPLGVPAMGGLATGDRLRDPSLVEAVGLAAALPT
ncbi:MAG TPA: MarR family transcriptional regulator [Candidatus Nanopelagicaceae bacterium]|nr:MarR family transcriptional regulator [Candidatus Nanopelagicaceae bacterium]